MKPSNPSEESLELPSDIYEPNPDDPVDVLLAQLKPPVEEVEATLVQHGIDRLVAWRTQKRYEERVKLLRNKARAYARDIESKAEQTASIVKLNVDANRRQRKAMIKEGDRKRKAREAQHREYLKRVAKRS